MIRFFKSPQPAALFAIPLIIIFLWAERFVSFPFSNDVYTMPLWSLLQDFFKMLPSWLSVLIFVLLISFEAIYFNLLVNRHEVLYRNSYLPALFFALFVSATPEFLTIHPIHLVNLILLRIFDKVFSLHKQNRAILAVFDCGFLAGLAALLYLPAIPFVLLLMFSLSIFRPFNIREWLVLLVAYALPFLFLSVIKFWQHELISFWDSFFSQLLVHPRSFKFNEELPLLVLAGVLGFILILSWLRLRANYYKNIIRVRTYQQILFFSFVLGIFSLYLSKDFGLIHYVIFAIPVSLWFSYYFVSQKKKLWMVEFLLWVLIGTIAWNHIA
jgi:hypothetical protein